jgi:hypothetical protein
MSLISVKAVTVSEINYYFFITSSVILVSMFLSISIYEISYANLTSLLTALNVSGYRYAIITLAAIRIR